MSVPDGESKTIGVVYRIPGAAENFEHISRTFFSRRRKPLNVSKPSLLVNIGRSCLPSGGGGVAAL